MHATLRPEVRSANRQMEPAGRETCAGNTPGGIVVSRARAGTAINERTNGMMKTKPFFIVTSLIEVGAGLALLVSPALAASILLGTSFDTPADLVVGRVGG